MEFQFALISMVYCFTDASRQMDVGGSDQSTLFCLLDGDDALQWVFRLFLFFPMAYQFQYLLFALREKSPITDT